MPDAGDGAGLKKTQLGQGQIRDSTRGNCYVGMKKTQPGPGDPLRIDLGDCGERKDGQSTESSSQAGAWGETTASSTGTMPQT